MSSFEVKNGFVYDGNLKVDINDVVELLNNATDKLAKLEQPQQAKTVADAYEAFPDGWPESLELPLGKGWWFNSNGELVWLEQHLTANKLTVVCNQLEFEAYAKEQEDKQEGEKWTHYYMGNEYCKIVVKTPDKFGVIVVDCEDNGYMTCEPSDLKPIKPKLTKAEAWDILSDFDESIHHFHDKYEAMKEQYDITD